MSNISALNGLDNRTASGILARAALAVSSGGVNPASRPFIAREGEIREQLLDLARQAVDPAAGEAIDEAILDWLDAQVEKLAEPVDEEAALSRLSLNALLPSDAYEINFDEGQLDYVRALDRDRTFLTIRSPDYQEDFTPSSVDSGPRTVSLFAKWFRSFTFEDQYLLVVISSRMGKQLLVSQTWRLYPADLYFKSVPSLISLVEKFAQAYGENFSVGTFTGKFLYHHRFKGDATQLTFGLPGPISDPFVITMTHGPSDQEGYSEVSFGMCINLRRYHADVSRHTRREQDRAKQQLA